MHSHAHENKSRVRQTQDRRRQKKHFSDILQPNNRATAQPMRTVATYAYRLRAQPILIILIRNQFNMSGMHAACLL